MDVWWIVALVGGWLVGSISGSRIVAARVIPGVPLSPTRVVLDDDGTAVVVRRVSPSMLNARAGHRAGLAAAAIDIAKALVPTSVAQLAAGEVVAAIVATGVVLGHVVPVTNPQTGGFGMSPIIGTMLVLDPLGLALAIAAAILVATAVGSPFFGTEVWVAFIPIWGWFRTDWPLVAFSTVTAALYLWTSRHELVGAVRSWRSDTRPWFGRWSDYWEYPVYEPVE